MLAFLLALFRFIRLLGSGHQAIALENVALRRQLAIYKRKHKRPRLLQRDRWFWMLLASDGRTGGEHCLSSIRVQSCAGSASASGGNVRGCRRAEERQSARRLGVRFVN